MKKYEPSKIESKWQKDWEEKGLHKTDLSKKPKFYCLVMYPYPSADKLHIGHWYNFGPTDTFARFKRMQGFNVFEPMGFDAFGLPAENYAIETGVHPKKSTEKNIEYITKQLKQIGAMYDWSKQVNTSTPEYYKWTQWLFLQLYKNGLVYKKKAPANYCPSCKTVLANEQVIDGLCERCDSQVIQKELEQWFFKITDYAEKLLSGLKKIDWPERTKIMQENWIGRSFGANVKFKIDNVKLENPFIEVFTTRPNTLFGTTYLVLAPEHPIVASLLKAKSKKQKAKIESYIQKTLKEREIERISLEKEKTGVFLGSYAINPVNNEKIPIWISDYVLVHYGTGAIMCVPAHDQRDFEFAKKFKLPIRQVISKTGKEQKLKEAYIDPGIMLNSGRFNGLPSEKFSAQGYGGSAETSSVGGKDEIVKWLSRKKLAKKSVCYKLRDWLVSRQRYWGAPIPIVYCQKCGQVSIPEKDLPVLLPEKVTIKPTGVSPLAKAKEFVNTKCPKCGKKAKRETDTMDTFVCSSWYFLRYLSPTLSEKPWDAQLSKKWLPVDLYIGGAEHATMHLIYARFIAKVFHDLKLVHFDEPFSKLRHQGIITYQGAKMSKSKGNVVIPDQFINRYGSDTFRMYLMFMGPYNEGGDWSDRGIVGIYRFLDRVYQVVNKIIEKKNFLEDISRKSRLIHATIKNVTEDIEKFKFNTAIASLMVQFNGKDSRPDWRPKLNQKGELEGNKVDFDALEKFLVLLAPFAPHLAEELWSSFAEASEDKQYPKSIFFEPWPKYNPKLIKEERMTIVIQVNGKVRDQMEVEAKVSEKEIKKQAQKTEKIKKWISGKKIQKIIYVPGRLVNIVL